MPKLPSRPKSLTLKPFSSKSPAWNTFGVSISESQNALLSKKGLTGPAGMQGVAKNFGVKSLSKASSDDMSFLSGQMSQHYGEETGFWGNLFNATKTWEQDAEAADVQDMRSSMIQGAHPLLNQSRLPSAGTSGALSRMRGMATSLSRTKVLGISDLAAQTQSFRSDVTPRAGRLNDDLDTLHHQLSQSSAFKKNATSFGVQENKYVGQRKRGAFGREIEQTQRALVFNQGSEQWSITQDRQTGGFGMVHTGGKKGNVSSVNIIPNAVRIKSRGEDGKPKEFEHVSAFAQVRDLLKQGAQTGDMWTAIQAAGNENVNHDAMSPNKRQNLSRLTRLPKGYEEQALSWLRSTGGENADYAMGRGSSHAFHMQDQLNNMAQRTGIGGVLETAWNKAKRLKQYANASEGVLSRAIGGRNDQRRAGYRFEQQLDADEGLAVSHFYELEGLSTSEGETRGRTFSASQSFERRIDGRGANLQKGMIFHNSDDLGAVAKGLKHAGSIKDAEQALGHSVSGRAVTIEGISQRDGGTWARYRTHETNLTDKDMVKGEYQEVDDSILPKIKGKTVDLHSALPGASDIHMAALKSARAVDTRTLRREFKSYHERLGMDGSFDDIMDRSGVVSRQGQEAFTQFAVNRFFDQTEMVNTPVMSSTGNLNQYLVGTMRGHVEANYNTGVKDDKGKLILNAEGQDYISRINAAEQIDDTTSLLGMFNSTGANTVTLDDETSLRLGMAKGTSYQRLQGLTAVVPVEQRDRDGRVSHRWEETSDFNDPRASVKIDQYTRMGVNVMELGKARKEANRETKDLSLESMLWDAHSATALDATHAEMRVAGMGNTANLDLVRSLFANTDQGVRQRLSDEGRLAVLGQQAFKDISSTALAGSRPQGLEYASDDYEDAERTRFEALKGVFGDKSLAFQSERGEMILPSISSVMGTWDQGGSGVARKVMGALDMAAQAEMYPELREQRDQSIKEAFDASWQHSDQKGVLKTALGMRVAKLGGVAHGNKAIPEDSVVMTRKGLMNATGFSEDELNSHLSDIKAGVERNPRANPALAGLPANVMVYENEMAAGNEALKGFKLRNENDMIVNPIHLQAQQGDFDGDRLAAYLNMTKNSAGGSDIHHMMTAMNTHQIRQIGRDGMGSEWDAQTEKHQERFSMGGFMGDVGKALGSKVWASTSKAAQDMYDEEVVGAGGIGVAYNAMQRQYWFGQMEGADETLAGMDLSDTDRQATKQRLNDSAGAFSQSTYQDLLDRKVNNDPHMDALMSVMQTGTFSDAEKKGGEVFYAEGGGWKRQSDKAFAATVMDHAVRMGNSDEVSDPEAYKRKLGRKIATQLMPLERLAQAQKDGTADTLINSVADKITEIRATPENQELGGEKLRGELMGMLGYDVKDLGEGNAMLGYVTGTNGEPGNEKRDVAYSGFMGSIMAPLAMRGIENQAAIEAGKPRTNKNGETIAGLQPYRISKTMQNSVDALGKAKAVKENIVDMKGGFAGAISALKSVGGRAWDAMSTMLGGSDLSVSSQQIAAFGSSWMNSNAAVPAPEPIAPEIMQAIAQAPQVSAQPPSLSSSYGADVDNPDQWMGDQPLYANDDDLPIYDDEWTGAAAQMSAPPPPPPNEPPASIATPDAPEPPRRPSAVSSPVKQLREAAPIGTSQPVAITDYDGRVPDAPAPAEGTDNAAIRQTASSGGGKSSVNSITTFDKESIAALRGVFKPYAATRTVGEMYGAQRDIKKANTMLRSLRGGDESIDAAEIISLHRKASAVIRPMMSREKDINEKAYEGFKETDGFFKSDEGRKIREMFEGLDTTMSNPKDVRELSEVAERQGMLKGRKVKELTGSQKDLVSNDLSSMGGLDKSLKGIVGDFSALKKAMDESGKSLGSLTEIHKDQKTNLESLVKEYDKVQGRADKLRSKQEAGGDIGDIGAQHIARFDALKTTHGDTISEARRLLTREARGEVSLDESVQPADKWSLLSDRSKKGERLREAAIKRGDFDNEYMRKEALGGNGESINRGITRAQGVALRGGTDLFSLNTLRMARTINSTLVNPAMKAAHDYENSAADTAMLVRQSGQMNGSEFETSAYGRIMNREGRRQLAYRRFGEQSYSMYSGAMDIMASPEVAGGALGAGAVMAGPTAQAAMLAYQAGGKSMAAGALGGGIGLLASYAAYSHGNRENYRDMGNSGSFAGFSGRVANTMNLMTQSGFGSKSGFTDAYHDAERAAASPLFNAAVAGLGQGATLDEVGSQIQGDISAFAGMNRRTVTAGQMFSKAEFTGGWYSALKDRGALKGYGEDAVSKVIGEWSLNNRDMLTQGNLISGNEADKMLELNRVGIDSQGYLDSEFAAQGIASYDIARRGETSRDFVSRAGARVGNDAMGLTIDTERKSMANSLIVQAGVNSSRTQAGFNLLKADDLKVYQDQGMVAAQMFAEGDAAFSQKSVFAPWTSNSGFMKNAYNSSLAAGDERTAALLGQSDDFSPAINRDNRRFGYGVSAASQEEASQVASSVWALDSEKNQYGDLAPQIAKLVGTATAEGTYLWGGKNGRPIDTMVENLKSLSDRGLDIDSIAQTRLAAKGIMPTTNALKKEQSLLTNEMLSSAFDAEETANVLMEQSINSGVMASERLAGNTRILTANQRTQLLGDSSARTAQMSVRQSQSDMFMAQDGFAQGAKGAMDTVFSNSFGIPAVALRQQQQLGQAQQMYQNMTLYGANEKATSGLLSSAATQLSAQNWNKFKSAASGDQMVLSQMAAQGKIGAQYQTIDLNTGQGSYQYGIDKVERGFIQKYARDNGLSDLMGSESMMAGGIRGMEMQSRNISVAQNRMQYTSQVAQQNIGYQMSVGGATGVNNQGFANGGDGLKSLSLLFQGQGRSLNVGNGMGQWQIQDRQTAIGREKTAFGMMQQQQSMDLGKTDFDLQAKHFYEKFSLNERQFKYNTANSRQDMAVGRSQSLRSREWQKEDMAYSRDQSELNFGWQMEDADRNVKYARGRERLDLIRQKDRAVISHSMEMGQMDKQEGRMTEQNKWEDDQFERQKKRFDQGVKFNEEEMEMQKRQFEEGRNQDQAKIDMQKAAFEMEKKWMQESYVLEDQSRLLERQNLMLQNEMQLRIMASTFAASEAQRRLAEATQIANEALQAQIAKQQMQAQNGQLLNMVAEAFGIKINAIGASAPQAMANLEVLIGGIKRFASELSGARNSMVVQPPVKMGNAAGNARGFADGGYTGNGGVNEVAGVVHGKEYVVPAEGVPVIRGDNAQTVELLKRAVAVLEKIATQPAIVQATIHTNDSQVKGSQIIKPLDTTYSRIGKR